MLEKIEGIVIKTQDYGETHKIITIFARKMGKFNALARGAKKPKSRMAAVTQPFIYGDFLVYVTSGLSTIRQGETVHSLRNIREDIFKTAHAAYIVELTDKLLDFKKPDAYLYDQLYLTLCWIQKHDDAEIPIIMYELKMFEKGGFSPVVDRCVHCGNRELPYDFSVSEGGFLCSTCRHIDTTSIKLPNSVAKLFSILASAGLEQVGKISVKEENKKRLRQILDLYYDTYGGYYLKSKKFLKQMDLLK